MSDLVQFSMGGMLFEYDEHKNAINIEKHGISLPSAARVFFDYDRIEFYDETHSDSEDRYDTIGDISTCILPEKDFVIGDAGRDDVVFVVYTERFKFDVNGNQTDITRLISARYATNFERGLYYGKF